MINPILSIVIPTREGLEEYWIQELLKVTGNIEFILVHPPGMDKLSIEDPRMQQINSAFRGEIIQRMTGLFNASGKYTLTINCDEYLNPQITEIILQYFKRFPDSWVMRLSTNKIKYGDRASLESPWGSIPNIEEMKICSRAIGNQNCYGQKDYILEMPIAPLDNQFDLGCIFRQRKDQNGPHTENFDKKIWQTKIVKETLEEISQTMIFGPFKYLPFWCLDRLLGLFLQAKFYEKGKAIGHLLPQPEQLRSEDNPPQYQRSMRFYVFAEILLLKRFPQYGYFWNLIVDQFRAIIERAVSFIFRKMQKSKNLAAKNT